MGSVTPALERNVQLLLESLDEFALQQREMQMYERQTRVNKEKMGKNQRVPRSIDTLNLAKQIQEHCKNLSEFSTDTFGKLYLASGNAKNSEVGRLITNLQ